VASRVGEAIPLAQPVIGELEIERVLDVLRSGRLSLGPLLAEFEQEFARRVGAAHASAVSSGTAGLHLALRAVGVTDGDEVVTSPFSFVASANVVVYERARPVFADIDPVTFNLDPDAATAAVTDRTTALLPVHIFGYPAELAAFERLGVPIVEDACEALGAVDADGVPVGGRGHPAVFGFYANKQIATGEGGMVTTMDAELKQRIDSERNQGRAPDMDWLDHDRLGFNYRLGEIACALGLAQLERLDELLAGRARVAAAYGEALADIDGVELPCDDSTPAHPRVRRGWFVYVVQLPRDVDRDSIVRALSARGIPSKPYFPAVHLMSYYRDTFGHREGEFPVCEDVAARSIALPFFPGMTESQVEQVAESLREVLGMVGGA
jgi:perosamine synthetase